MFDRLLGRDYCLNCSRSQLWQLPPQKLVIAIDLDRREKTVHRVRHIQKIPQLLLLTPLLPTP